MILNIFIANNFVGFRDIKVSVPKRNAVWSIKGLVNFVDGFSEIIAVCIAEGVYTVPTPLVPTNKVPLVPRASERAPETGFE